MYGKMENVSGKFDDVDRQTMVGGRIKNTAHLSGLMGSIKPPNKKTALFERFLVAVLPGLNYMSIGGIAVTVKQDCVPVSTIMEEGQFDQDD